ncbi:endonuclease/exonuclease/phosphatase family protein [Nitratifractor salsuginis]|uniref:Endonuclease/exonuclease/phosphatase n=1 Tax=Nitratifractor salsuginis (strain DSM 16511 / JCM 12458 / E9I37-1) TaxID=749222 RepID=E6X1Y6_NITSE|nr:endonuclease/exonuclease/phosphatase family protein [Nitratifractor salsuginis]ADV45994.1 Endonuclease/exonuclease/phosphatase [Nitratifractor salsuginis DSM 16511]
MKFFFLLFLFLLTWQNLHSRTIKIASWNVENLFDMHYQGTEYEEYVPGRHGWSEAMLRKKLEHTAQVICDLDADVIGLQEIENDEVLSRLQRLLKRVGCPYPYRAVTGGRAPVHTALLSRIPLAKVRDLPVTRYGRQRPILEATLRLDPSLKIFVNHWRSKRGPESERILYAKALRKRLMKLPPSTEYLLLGDFNSDWEEFRIIDPKLNDTGGITGINQVMATTRDGRMVRYRDLKRGQREFLHYNLWLDLPASQRWSHNFYGNKEAIDAMLIPPSLADGRRWEYVRGSFGVYRPSYLFGIHGEILRWGYRHGKHTGKGFSDHLPIYARFQTLPDLPVKTSAPEAKKPLPPGRLQCHKVTITQLQKAESPALPLCLDNAVVTFKRGPHAVLQEEGKGPTILVYGAAAALKEGHRYRIEVEGFKRYHGLPEIVDLEPLKDLGRVDLAPYIPAFRPEMMNDPAARFRVVRDLEGIYRHRQLWVRQHAWPIHFRSRRWKPKEGSRLRIKRAQIGYYKGHPELVIWDRNDFETVR